jgi:hypothetical protein
MDIRLQSDARFAYGGAYAWREAPLRLQEAGQNTPSREIQAGGEKTPVVSGSTECQTCKRRKYLDASGDSTVSFQTPTTLSPQAAEVAVRAHEQQHVVHEQARAGEQGRKVVFQDVSIHYTICPECGRMVVAGGTTVTMTRAAQTYNASGPSRSGPTTGKFVDARI